MGNHSRRLEIVCLLRNVSSAGGTKWLLSIQPIAATFLFRCHFRHGPALHVDRHSDVPGGGQSIPFFPEAVWEQTRSAIRPFYSVNGLLVLSGRACGIGCHYWICKEHEPHRYGARQHTCHRDDRWSQRDWPGTSFLDTLSLHRVEICSHDAASV